MKKKILAAALAALLTAARAQAAKREGDDGEHQQSGVPERVEDEHKRNVHQHIGVVLHELRVLHQFILQGQLLHRPGVGNHAVLLHSGDHRGDDLIHLRSVRLVQSHEGGVGSGVPEGHNATNER